MPTERGPQPTSIVLVYGADHGPGIYTEEVEWSAAVERAAKMFESISGWPPGRCHRVMTAALRAAGEGGTDG